MYPVVVSDLDGTLLNDNHELTARTRQVIHQLSAQGVKFIFATGRHYLDVDAIRSDLGISMYLITSNGARVHNPEGEAVIRNDIYADYLAPLIALGRKYGNQVLTSIYQEDNWFVEQENKKLLDYHRDSGFGYIKCDLDQVEKKGVQKVFFNSEHSHQLESLVAELKAQFSESLSLTYSLPTCFEVMAPGVCKGVALAEVLKLKGYEFKDAIAFGDGQNDFEMLQAAGKGVIMGSAGQELRSKLPDYEVIGLAGDNAVADYLDKIYRKE